MRYMQGLLCERKRSLTSEAEITEPELCENKDVKARDIALFSSGCLESLSRLFTSTRNKTSLFLQNQRSCMNGKTSCTMLSPQFQYATTDGGSTMS